MNKYYKLGLICQLPNIIIITLLAIVYAYYSITTINLDLKSIVYIILGSIYAIFNIASTIFFVLGVLEWIDKI